LDFGGSVGFSKITFEDMKQSGSFNQINGFIFCPINISLKRQQLSSLGTGFSSGFTNSLTNNESCYKVENCGSIY
jgi:hypothetical protein